VDAQVELSRIAPAFVWPGAPLDVRFEALLSAFQAFADQPGNQDTCLLAELIVIGGWRLERSPQARFPYLL
jgi:hypothetical protein